MQPLCIFGSSRPNGNSELLAERVIQGIPADRIYLRDAQLPHIVDRRHDPDGFGPVSQEIEPLYRALLSHDPLVFVTPLYWYGMSGLMKDFIDLWSHVSRDPRFNFKEAMRGKEAYVVIVGGTGARRLALPLVQQFGLIFDFVGATYAGYLIGEGGRPGEVLNDQRALAEAGALNEKLRVRCQ